MKVAYIAGPYNAPTTDCIRLNIERACKVATKYWKLGYAVVCPHTNTTLQKYAPNANDNAVDSTGVSRGQTLAGDIAIMLKCDIVVMMQGWQRSVGATAEHEVAVEHGMEIIYE